MKLIRKILKRLRNSFAGTIPSGWDWTDGNLRVLFVASDKGSPFYYRVLNQAEQLSLQHISHGCRFEWDRSLSSLAEKCDLLYLYRVTGTSQVLKSISIARKNGTPVIYDTDDVIWTEKLIEYCQLRSYYSETEVDAFRALFQSTEQLMGLVDSFVTSSDYLAKELVEHFGIPAYVNANALSQRALALAEPVYRRRIAATPGSSLTLGYFSGWPKAHESDLMVALPAVRRVLHEVQGARLRIVGHFDRAALPDDLRDRIDLAPFVPYERLFKEIARVDVNLAPLVNNPHRRAKSAVKFLEAALVGVPTVASNLEPYRIINHGRTGLLVADDEGWYASIMALAVDPMRRRAMGEAARDYVVQHETTQARAPAFAALVRRLIAEHRKTLR